MNRLFTSLFLLLSFALYGQIDSDDNFTGLWNNENSWDGGASTTYPEADGTNTIPLSKGLDIDLFGYITRGGSLVLPNAGNNTDRLIINDTLVISGDLTFEANSKELFVPSDGVLIVFGNLTLGNKASIENGGTVVVKGNTTLEGGQTNYTNSGGSFYTDGIVSGAGGSDAADLDGDDQPIANLNGTGDQGLQDLYDFIQSNDPTNTLLPVELLDFSTVNKPYSVDLVWSTASESNTSHFEIYKSSNGEEFFLESKVNAVGNSITTQHYSYNDKAPFSGYNFYKLKSVDFDGYTEVFDVILNEFQFEGLQPYPNPFDGKQLSLSSFTEIGDLDIMITDIGGRVVYQGRLEDEKQLIEMNPVLEKGMYFIKIRNEQRNYNYSTRLIVR